MHYRTGFSLLLLLNNQLYLGARGLEQFSERARLGESGHGLRESAALAASLDLRPPLNSFLCRWAHKCCLHFGNRVRTDHHVSERSSQERRIDASAKVPHAQGQAAQWNVPRYNVVFYTPCNN